MFKKITKYHILTLIFINLLLIGLIVSVIYFTITFSSNQDTKKSDNAEDGTFSEFTINYKSYDILPGKDYVIYTNYACPYCATLYKQLKDKQYTTRLLLLDKEDSARFNTQNIVSPFMLKLSRFDYSKFFDTEKYLFDFQDTWTNLDNKGVLALLNGLNGLCWNESDFEYEFKELCVCKNEKPKDLEFVPILYSNNKIYTDLINKITNDSI